MTDDERNHEALFRHAILGDVLSRNPRRGQLRPELKQLAEQTYQDHHGRPRRVAYKTLEEWFYKYRHGGFDDTCRTTPRSEEHTSDSSHTVISYAVFCLKKKKRYKK